MADFSKQTRFFYDSYRKIQDEINRGQINKWDIVLCSDTREMILISDSFELIPIHSKVLRFTDIQSAETIINELPDTYQGQMLSILNDRTGTYQAYIVNQNDQTGRFYVLPISVYGSEDVDYREISHRPIDIVSGNIESPAILANLPTGVYKVDGSYKLTDTHLTIFDGYDSQIFLITQTVDGPSIRIVSNDSIVTYRISSDGQYIYNTETVATQEWIRSQGYAGLQEVEAKLQAMNLITKEEATEFIEEVIDESATTIINERFDAEFDQRIEDKFEEEDQANIYALFDIFYPGAQGVEIYQGVYEVTPRAEGQTLETENRYLQEDVEIFGIPYYEVSNENGTTISIG